MSHLLQDSLYSNKFVTEEVLAVLSTIVVSAILDSLVLIAKLLLHLALRAWQSFLDRTLHHLREALDNNKCALEEVLAMLISYAFAKSVSLELIVRTPFPTAPLVQMLIKTIAAEEVHATRTTIAFAMLDILDLIVRHPLHPSVPA